MSDLRAAVIGYGQMGRHHARVLGDLPGVELVGVVEPGPPERAPVSFVSDLEQLLTDRVDLAVVAVPTRCTRWWPCGSPRRACTRSSRSRSRRTSPPANGWPTRSSRPA